MPKRSTLRLTKRIVDRLRVEEKDSIFWDRDLTGFGKIDPISSCMLL